MSEKALDNLLLLALFLTAVGDLISLFVEIQSQRQASEQDNFEQQITEDIRALHHEIALLKRELGRDISLK